MVVGVARREAAVGLERLASQIAAPVAALAAEHGGRVGQQRLGGLALARTLEDLGEQPGRERELVALPGQGERLQLARAAAGRSGRRAVERAQRTRSGGGAALPAAVAS